MFISVIRFQMVNKCNLVETVYISIKGLTVTTVFRVQAVVRVLKFTIIKVFLL